MAKKHKTSKWMNQWSDDEGSDDDIPNTRILSWRDKHRKKMAFSVVGTNNYMAPEVLRGMGYDKGCDWWSLGVSIMMLINIFNTLLKNLTQTFIFFFWE